MVSRAPLALNRGLALITTRPQNSSNTLRLSSAAQSLRRRAPLPARPHLRLPLAAPPTSLRSKCKHRRRLLADHRTSRTCPHLDEPHLHQSRSLRRQRVPLNSRHGHTASRLPTRHHLQAARRCPTIWRQMRTILRWRRTRTWTWTCLVDVDDHLALLLRRNRNNVDRPVLHHQPRPVATSLSRARQPTTCLCQSRLPSTNSNCDLNALVASCA